jgi:hypothetical protein
MPSNSAIDLVSLDFDAHKASFIAFMQTQQEFKDYDFVGSNLNILNDNLAYNTMKNAFYLNMAISEGFLDSAQLLPSVLSHAKELNYLPRSIRSAKATVQVLFTATADSAPYIISKGQSFTAQVKNQSFIFSIPETLIVASSNTTFTFTTDIYEGAYVKDSYFFDTTSLLPLRFRLTNANVDIDSIVVNVFEDSLTGEIYRRVISLLDLDGNSKVYFIQTSAVDGNYEIMFGDGILGYQPKNGSLIVIDYRLSMGEIANGSGRFTINFDPTSPFSELSGTLQTTTLTAAIGGAPAEDIETIRFYAPRWFQTQERAIVPTDYKVLLKIQFPEIHAVNVYGGETLTPPLYGKVMVALQISNVQGLPQSKLQQYYDFLKTRCPLSIIPLFTSPAFTYVQINSSVKYNVNVTNETVNRMKTIILTAISAYNTQNLDDFEVTFLYSHFCSIIDNADSSIISNLTTISLYKKINPTPNISQDITLDYAVPLLNILSPIPTSHPLNIEKTLWSSNFTFNGLQCQLEDDGQGNVRIVQATIDKFTMVVNIGTINYTTGLVQLNGFKPDAYDGASLCVYVQPQQNDVSCHFNTIMLIEPEKVVLAVQQVTA